MYIYIYVCVCNMMNIALSNHMFPGLPGSNNIYTKHCRFFLATFDLDHLPRPSAVSVRMTQNILTRCPSYGGGSILNIFK